jgi:hypothetical protein
MKKRIPFYFAMALAPTMAFSQVIVNDSWSDGNRANTGSLQADWWSSTSTGNNSVEAGAGSLGLVTGSSGRGLHGTFTPQTLAIGDKLTATFAFRTPATVGTESGGGGFRFAIADFNNAGLAADLQSGSSFVQPLFQNLPSYMVDFDVNRPAVADDTSIRKHGTPEAAGRFMGTTAGWTQLGTSTDIDYAIAPNTDYVAVISLTRTGVDSMDIFGSLSQGSTLLTSHSLTDTSAIVNNLGLLGVWVNSNLMGTSPTIGATDNGIDFSNILIERSVVPEPSVLALSAAALFSMRFLRNRKLGSR